jgi:predicted small metal-binding protein
MDKLTSIECDPECGFMVRSHDRKEVMDTARSHVKMKHGMDVSDNDLKKKMKAM